MASAQATSRECQADVREALAHLGPAQRANTLVWLALTISDALPRDDRFPPFLSAFTSAFISGVLGQDPHGDPEAIRGALARFAKSHPPDATALRALLRSMRGAVASLRPDLERALEVIGREVAVSRQPDPKATLERSPLGVRFGFRPAREKQ